MVPEWQQAYMNYGYLKSLLKDIILHKQRNKGHSSGSSSGLKRKLSLHRTFSGLTQRHYQPLSPDQDIENQPILVHSVLREGHEKYETTFLMASEEGGEYELVYFRRLDDEFNKVVSFYMSKVEEVMKEAAELNKQMDALVAFRVKVQNPTQSFDCSVEMTRLASDVSASTTVLHANTPRGVQLNSKFPSLSAISACLFCLESCNCWIWTYISDCVLVNLSDWLLYFLFDSFEPILASQELNSII